MLLQFFLQTTGQSPYTSFIFILTMFLVFWLCIIRPQAKRQKEQTKFMSSLKKDDEVVTSAGILGRITKVEENIITIEVGAKVYLRVTRSSISKELTEAIYGTSKKPTAGVEKSE